MSFAYSKKPEVGKAYVGMLRGTYRIWIYDHVTDTTSSAYHTNHVFKSYKEAQQTAFAMNDWQWLDGKVYRFLDGLNMQPWEHAFVHEGKAYIFIWDTRELVHVAKYDGELKTPANDNGRPISKNGKWLFMSQLTAIPATECDMSDAGNINLAPPATDVNEGIQAMYEVRLNDKVLCTNCNLRTAKLMLAKCRRAKLIRIG